MSMAAQGPEEAAISIQGVWTRFATDPRWVHRALDLDVAPGESVAVIGGSGAGKSVLLKLLIGLRRPEKGRIVVQGVEVSSASEPELYALMERVGVVFQFGALFDSLPIWQNVTFALESRRLCERELRLIAGEKLKMVGLRGIEDRLPSELSGGMRKRVGLARAIVREPQVLLCDEPTSGLDPVMSDTISELIAQMRDRLGVTTVTITHDMKSAYKTADRIAMLYRGSIFACDTPDRIQRSDDPIVQQFIQGRAFGPMSTLGQDRGAE